MNTPDDAPNLLRKNPETDEENIDEQFMQLYRLARKHLCYRILQSSFVDSVWESTMRPKWDLEDHNPIEYQSRLDKIINRAWQEIRPATQQVGLFVDADATLLDVHSGLPQSFSMDKVIPEKVVLLNLRRWITQGLYHFWEHRLTGERYALFNVQKNAVQLKGVVPETILDVYASGPQSVPYKYR
jgi:hypothetical protein